MALNGPNHLLMTYFFYRCWPSYTRSSKVLKGCILTSSMTYKPKDFRTLTSSKYISVTMYHRLHKRWGIGPRNCPEWILSGICCAVRALGVPQTREDRVQWLRCGAWSYVAAASLLVFSLKYDCAEALPMSCCSLQCALGWGSSQACSCH
jgi:hypothetical protein